MKRPLTEGPFLSIRVKSDSRPRSVGKEKEESESLGLCLGLHRGTVLLLRMVSSLACKMKTPAKLVGVLLSRAATSALPSGVIARFRRILGRLPLGGHLRLVAFEALSDGLVVLDRRASMRRYGGIVHVVLLEAASKNRPYSTKDLCSKGDLRRGATLFDAHHFGVRNDCPVTGESGCDSRRIASSARTLASARNRFMGCV